MSFGVYVHVPFCTRRCDYCAFATWTDRDHLMRAYADACVAELADVERDATSVFFGGGTPSLLPAASLLAILAAVPRSPSCEVTVECNPETVTAAMFEEYKAGGVTRVSLGVQSTRPHVLTGFGREHDPDAARRAIELARAAGFTSWNVDLIYGGAGESDEDWAQTLAHVLAYDPPHVSAYALTVEAGTPLARDPARHPDDDASATRYALATDALAGAGLANYEISNWARPGHECRHNLLYWTQGDYRGIGCAAHSHQQGRRWWNVRTPERYIERIGAGRSPEAGAEVLDDAERRMEGLTLALRTRQGVPAEALVDRQWLAQTGLVEEVGGRAVLTMSGRLLANEVALRLR